MFIMYSNYIYTEDTVRENEGIEQEIKAIIELSPDDNVKQALRFV